MSHIVNIEYELVKPLIEYSLNQIKLFLNQDRDSLINFYFIFAILQISLLVMATFYVIRFPLEEMEQRVRFTKDLISIIPSEQAKAPVLTLATLTT